jgi:hypothetical protein
MTTPKPFRPRDSRRSDPWARVGSNQRPLAGEARRLHGLVPAGKPLVERDRGASRAFQLPAPIAADYRGSRSIRHRNAVSAQIEVASTKVDELA